MFIRKVKFFKFGSKISSKVSYHVKKELAAFASLGHLDEILNKISYPILEGPVDFIP